MRNKIKKRRGLAISQIFLLIISIVAISYAIGSSIGFVSAQVRFIEGPDGSVWEKDIGETYWACIEESCTFGNLKTEEELCESFGADGISAGICKSTVRELVPGVASTTDPRTGLGLPTIPSLISIPPVLKIPAPGIPGLGKGSTNPLEGALDREIGEVLKGAEPKKPPKMLTSAGFFFKGLLKNAAYSALVYAGVRFIFSKFAPEVANTAAWAAAGGFFVGKTLINLGFTGLLGGSLIGLGVGLFIFFAFAKQTELKVVSFSCNPWDAQSGGKNCEKCKNQLLGCSEYQCRSLGRSCEIINKGTTEELCTWVNRNDVNPPVMQPWEEPLTIDYRYLPDNTISPPDRGVRIVREGTNDCIQPFTPLRFGITLDEPAKCKIDPVRKDSFEDMNFFFGRSSTSKYNHSHQLSLPSLEALEAQNITLENGGEFALYARCEDSNGNSNVANFVFRFCVDEEADTTNPLIVTTSILNNAPIAFGQNSVDLQVHLNEPAECRWSKVDQDYENMATQMSCDTNVIEMNAQLLYRCSTTLTGLKDRTNNDFYFRCKDQPHLKGTDQESDRNTNPTSCIFKEDPDRCKFTLVGTRPLVIDSVSPNETIKDSTDIIKITLTARTSAGFKEGEAICSFSDTGEDGSFVRFFETESHQHSQDLFLPEGDYTYHIRCVDLGGNADDTTTSFRVETDTQAPVVVRAFHSGSSLKLITNEEAECVYSTSNSLDCSYLFEDGIKMTVNNDIEHTTNWNPNTNFYIKCQDEFGNRPFPDQCSITVRPFEV